MIGEGGREGGREGRPPTSNINLPSVHTAVCFAGKQAIQMGTKQVDEDGLLDLIGSLPGKKSKYLVAAEKEGAKVSFLLGVFVVMATCSLI